MSEDQRKQWFHACAEIGDVECLASLGPEMTLTPADRGHLEALEAGTLAPPKPFEHARPSRPVSRALALERWALPPRTAGDRIERLKLVRDMLVEERSSVGQ